MKNKNYITDAENVQFRTPTGYFGGIFRFPGSEKYGTSRAISDAYEVIERSQDANGVKREILLASIAAGFYALYPELLNRSSIQPFSLTLIGPPSTFKTTLNRKLRFPPTPIGVGEIEQTLTKDEQKAVWEECTGGSIVLNDLRGQTDDNKRLFHLLDSVVRPISDRKEGPVVAFLNGEPSFWDIKNFPESMRQRLLVIKTDTLQKEGRWVYELDNAMVSEVLITVHDKLQENSPWLDEVKECFRKEAEKTFLAAVDSGKSVRSHNAAFLIRFAHQVILDVACKSNFISEKAALHWLKMTHKSVASMLICQEIREHSIEFAFRRCISNINQKLRLVEKRPFCGTGNWPCVSGCTDYTGSYESCRTREYRSWTSDLYLRDSELGVVFSPDYLDKQFLHFRVDNNHVVVIVKWNQFKEEFLHAVREIEEMSSLTIKILEEDLKHFLIEEEMLLYKFRNRKRNIDHTVSWPICKCYPVRNLSSDKATRAIVLYLPKKLINNAATDEVFYTFPDGGKKKGLPLDQLRAMWRGSPTLCG